MQKDIILGINNTSSRVIIEFRIDSTADEYDLLFDKYEVIKFYFGGRWRHTFIYWTWLLIDKIMNDWQDNESVKD